MHISYRLTACIIALVTAAVIIRLVRRNALHAREAAWWLAASLFAVFAGVFPGAFDVLGHALGVGYPPILFLILALVAFAVRLLSADVERTRMELIQRRLVQRHAQLSLRLGAIERELGLRGVGISEQAKAPLAGDGREAEAAAPPPEFPAD